jgi:F-type H+-transporting ATPase subunit delta
VVPNKIARRYAHSLYQLAVERNTTDVLLRDMQGLVSLASQSTDLLAFFQSPILSSNKKIAAFNGMFKGKAQAPTLKLFDILARRKREALLPQVAQAFVDEYNRAHNITPVQISTAHELTEAQVQDIVQKIEAALKTQVQASTTVDPRLIAGFVLTVGDKLYDTSAETALRELKQQFNLSVFTRQL